MIKMLAERATTTKYAAWWNLFSRVSAVLARQAVILFLRRVLLRGTLITVAFTVVITIFDDDALEKWCKRSLYRGPKFKYEKPYKDAEEELAALYSALLEII